MDAEGLLKLYLASFHWPPGLPDSSSLQKPGTMVSDEDWWRIKALLKEAYPMERQAKKK
jgi:hypothetical protein